MIQLMAEELEPAELLPVGTTLHRRYTIDGVLGRGTYGITYFGHDEKTGTRIALKEYFPYARITSYNVCYTKLLRYLIIAFAPVVILGIILAVLTVAFYETAFWTLYLIQIVNLSGAAGDFYVV